LRVAGFDQMRFNTLLEEIFGDGLDDFGERITKAIK
jgi:hypothetical protein